MNEKIANLPLKRIDGTDTSLSAFKGKVLLVVNVASQCGLTPQYDGLEKLHKNYQARGLVVMGFPANEFGAQEPGTNAEIQEFCRSKFGIDFPMFSKIVVKGEGQHPLYQHLTETIPEARFPTNSSMRARLEKHGMKQQKSNDILWNFEKFLINRQGDVVARFSPDTTPDDPALLQAIEAELARA
ncbi:glutathione peroxidase [Cystobacter ferrugineus]|uniref:Glutathione peroxidase n=1 Tax=Cystobacter ferrugineus TaxID=83449 RepID=A0A1L9BJ25_9BACT|nr:glutathione peroxidase [Cystobacter ferrugineus]OJH42253.1 glutathione peroxidase [Cystobacter ferrugineus]